MAQRLRFAIFLSCLLGGGLLGAGALPPQSSKITMRNISILGSRSEGDASGSTASLLRDQLISPAEVIAVLLIIGGDIIQKACAQLSCGRGLFIPPPVAFSFGWVAYAFGALMSAFGDGSLMPSPDISSVVATVGGQWKNNESWVLGRLIRDLELEHKRAPGGLKVVFYETSGDSSKPHRDKLWMSFLFFIPVQFGIAAIPLYHGNWSILLITGIGTALAIATASLPQWRDEKYNGRHNAQGRYVLTRGNGHGHAFVLRIVEGHEFINLEDLAVTRTKATRFTRTMIGVMAILWIVLLIIAGGMKEDTWFLLLVGLIGMFQNVLVAGLTRPSEAHGFPLQPDSRITPNFVEIGGVMTTLRAAEEKSEGVGLALVSFFFPAGLRPDEEKWWKDRADAIQKRREERKNKVVKAEMHETKDPDAEGNEADNHVEVHTAEVHQVHHEGGEHGDRAQREDHEEGIYDEEGNEMKNNEGKAEKTTKT